MNGQFAKWGNSLALRIPNAVAKELRISDGKAAELRVRGGSLVITPISGNDVYDIAKLAAAITPENRHGETETGRTVGNEVG